MTQTQRSPLARLVLFMVCLSVAGTFLAGAHYYAVDLPAQQSIPAPTNGPHWDQDCINLCRTQGPPPEYYCLVIRNCFHE
jgi:hypothetical protein